MKKKISMEQDFSNTQKRINKANIALEPRDVYLAYIAKSLCIIADKMTDTKPEGRLCDGCKHKKFPDGDGACLMCCEYYDCQYEEE